MERLKRWVPVIALALALVMGVGQPMQAFAVSDYIGNNAHDVVDLQDFYLSETSSDGVITTQYCVSSRISGVHMTDLAWNTSKLYEDGRYATVTTLASLNYLKFYLAFGDTNYTADSAYRDCFNFSAVCDVEDYAGSFVLSSVRISCDGSCSGTATFCVDYGFMSGDSQIRIDTLEKSQTFSCSSSLSSDLSLSIDLSNLPSDATWIRPYFTVLIKSASAGVYTADCVNFIYSVRTAEKFAASPILSQSWTATARYYTPGSTASPLTVTTTYGNGEVGTVTYQWYKSTSGSSGDGVAISGATSSSYTPPTSALGTTYYYCVVTNTYEDKVASATTSQACIKVVETPKAPQITQNLSSGTMEYTQGDTASPFVISAINSGDGTLSYQWYRNTTNSTSGGSLISGATKSSYTPSTATVGTQYYYCVVTNSVGTLSESTVSNVGAIRVVPPPDPAQAPTINPNLSTSIKDYYIGDSAAELKIGASVTDGGTLSYQWYTNTINSTSGGTLLPGETDRTFTPPTDALGTRYYYCVVTNTLPDSSASTTSNVACIRVKELPKASAPVISTNLPSDPIVYTEGDAAAAIGISARSPDGGVLSYQWYKNTVPENTGGTAIAGADKSSYEPDTSEVGTAYYYVVITNSLNGTSASVTSSVATVVVEQDKVPDLIGDVIEGITNLPQMILDGIVGLFVPDEETMAAYQDQWTELLSSRFGAVYESIDMIMSVTDVFKDSGVSVTSLKVPKVTVDLVGISWTFGGWDVVLVPEGFEFFADSLKTITNIVVTVSFLNAMKNKLFGILDGGS